MGGLFLTSLPSAIEVRPWGNRYHISVPSVERIKSKEAEYKKEEQERKLKEKKEKDAEERKRNECKQTGGVPIIEKNIITDCALGSYTATCKNCSYDRKTLTCSCKTQKKYDAKKAKKVSKWKQTTINPKDCNFKLKNDDGNLKCE